MNVASIKSLAAKIALATAAAGISLVTGVTPAQAQHFDTAFQYGSPAYVVNHDNYGNRAFSARQRAEREAYERRQHEEFLRRQRWEREQRYLHHR